jgi:acetoin utilization protein AcuC
MTEGPIALLRDDAALGYDLGPEHPLAPVRVELTHALIDALGLSAAPGVVRPAPDPFDPADLGRVHDPAYVAAVRDLSARLRTAADPRAVARAAGAAAHGLGAGDTPAFAGMHEASLAVVGASVAAARHVLSGRARHAFNPGGGLHHAMPDRAAGFCVYNDPALAIDALLRDGAERVAYVDVDVHHGDGVERIFRADRRVLTISLHESGQFLFPGTGEPDDVGEAGAEGSVVNVPLAPRTPGEVWLGAFDAVVEPLVRAFAPDVLVTQLGCDTHHLDPLAHLALTLDDLAALYARLHRLAHEAAGGRWVATGGGGYRLVDVVPRAWALAFAEMTGAWSDGRPAALPPDWVDLVRMRLGVAAPEDLSDPAPHLEPSVREAVRGFAELSVATVRRLAFPHHGLR